MGLIWYLFILGLESPKKCWMGLDVTDARVPRWRWFLKCSDSDTKKMYPAINREKSLHPDLLPTCSALFGKVMHCGNFSHWKPNIFRIWCKGPFGKHGVDFFPQLYFDRILGGSTDRTLWLCQNSYGKWLVIVDFPIKNWWFSIAMLNYQMVYTTVLDTPSCSRGGTHRWIQTPHKSLEPSRSTSRSIEPSRNLWRQRPLNKPVLSNIILHTYYIYIYIYIYTYLYIFILIYIYIYKWYK
jgi:hypothetical protein